MGGMIIPLSDSYIIVGIRIKGSFSSLITVGVKRDFVERLATDHNKVVD